MKIPHTISAVSLCFAVAASFGLAGCGGGGGGGAATPNGIYSGSITGGEPTFNGVEEKGAIYDGRMMVLSVRPDGIGQLFDASLLVTGANLEGDGFRYDNITVLNTVSYSGSFVTGQTATIDFVGTGAGASSLPNGTLNLIASPDLMARGADTSRLDASWTGLFGPTNFGQMNLTFDASGTITLGSDVATDPGQTLDCGFSGSLTPFDASVNIYNVNITSNGGGSAATCSMEAGDYTGLAWTEGGDNNYLVLMVSNGNNARAVVLTRN